MVVLYVYDRDTDGAEFVIETNRDADTWRMEFHCDITLDISSIVAFTIMVIV